MSLISALETRILQRLTGSLPQLSLPALPTLPVLPWQPARQRVALPPQGAALMLLHRGSHFAHNHALAVLQDSPFCTHEAHFELSLLSCRLHAHEDPVPGQPAGTDLHTLLERCQLALLGWQPESASAAIRLCRTQFSGRLGAQWRYGLHFVVPLITLAAPADKADAPVLRLHHIHFA